jgi:hypothetical protein
MRPSGLPIWSLVVSRRLLDRLVEGAEEEVGWLAIPSAQESLAGRRNP